ncbi:histidine kinase [Geobacter anodireducens]|uniref:histidine kinase n=2 Tax=Geobacter anodireducens TaxID=1340425 RepID=A0ABR9NY99_9BACT|nr:histidine kinase [Geobacter anodireducens]
MFRLIRRRCFVCALARLWPVVMLVGAYPAPARADYEARAANHILVLHSYHPGYPWADQVMAGIQDVLSNSFERIHMDVEYLDVKRHRQSAQVSRMFDAVLHHKLRQRSFNLVIASGNEALDYALANRRDLFRGAPIVSCATVGPDPLPTASDRHTGVRADPDCAGVIRQALALHPGTTGMIVIGGTRELTDRLNAQRLMAVSQAFAGRVTFDFWNDLSAEEIIARLQSPASGTLILINGSIRDRSGNLLSFHEQTGLLRQAGLPLYSFWNVFLGEGTVGGPFVDVREQGRLAARAALRVLHGEPVADIPVVQSASSVPIFDYEELQRLGISPRRLPPKHILVNGPKPFYNLTKSQFLWAVAILLGSLSITLLLTWSILLRRRAERRLRQSEQNYRQLSRQFGIILDGIPDSLTLISHDMKVVWSNKVAGEPFGAPLRTVPGEYCCEMLYNRTTLCDNCPAVRAFESGENEESTITTPDGRTLEVKAFPVREGSEMVSHVIMLASDISDKVRLLEETVRTSRLASLGELAAGVAHEINNPNAVILLNVDLVKKVCREAIPLLLDRVDRQSELAIGGIPWSEMREELPLLLTEMEEGAGRIKRIVDDLKDFARGDGADQCEPVDLNEAVRASVRLAGNAIKNATDHFVLELAPGLPSFEGSIQRIEQVVVNLIMNACQSLQDKTNGITVSTGYDPLRGVCTVQVRDEGQGIPPEVLPRITDPFFTTKRETGGTGLGLSICMRIVRSYGGTLEFQSAPGAGTTATLSLPAEKEVIAA